MKIVWAALAVAAAIVIIGTLAIIEFGNAVLRANVNPPDRNASPARSEFHHSYDLSPSGSVSIDDARGTIRVIGWDKNSVQVDAVLFAPNAQDLRNLSVSVDQRPNAIDISTIFPSWTSVPWWRAIGWHMSWDDLAPHVDYLLYVPSRAKIKAKAVSADIVVSGLSGQLQADDSSGDVSATDVGDAVVGTASGDVTVTDARGTIETTTISGDVLFRNVRGGVLVNSTSGEVRLYTVSGKVAATTTSGDITARSFSGIGHVSSTSGEQSVTLRHLGDVSISASTISGDIRSDVPMRAGAPIELRTVSGDITVRYSE